MLFFSNMVQWRRLSQADADGIMRALSDAQYNNFVAAFHEEADRSQAGSGWRHWALPEDEREYYVIDLEMQPYLLVGLNVQNVAAYIGLSSFARIAPAPNGYAADCLAPFMRCQLERCKGMVPPRPGVSAQLSAGGYKVFLRIKQMPYFRDIMNITDAGRYWSLTMQAPCVH